MTKTRACWRGVTDFILNGRQRCAQGRDQHHINDRRAFGTDRSFHGGGLYAAAERTCGTDSATGEGPLVQLNRQARS